MGDDRIIPVLPNGLMATSVTKGATPSTYTMRATSSLRPLVMTPLDTSRLRFCVLPSWAEWSLADWPLVIGI